MLQMHLHPTPFTQIKTDQKTIELRLNDEKRQLIMIGEVIEFINRETEEKIRARVVELLTFPDFWTLHFDNCEIRDCGAETKEELLAVFSEFYTRDNVE
jgi:ASC-1-like (ASCH) protein